MGPQTVQQQLQKVIKSNWCLICGINLSNKIAAKNHFMNIHHEGVFACKILGCHYVAKTNGDLRMHHLLWHSNEQAQNIRQPVSS